MFIDVEMEVLVRKYEVDVEGLMQCLKRHKGNRTIKRIAEELHCPVTMAEHWFRQDKYFAVPDADIWMDIKKLLNIQTSEYDEQIMTFEARGGRYDMANRIYIGDISPTLKCDSGKDLYLVEQK